MRRQIILVSNMLVGILAFFTILYVAKDILMPIFTAALLSFALYPLSLRLQKKGIPPVFAILLSLLSVFMIVAGLLTMITVQITSFAQDIPGLIAKFNDLRVFVQDYIESTLKIKSEKQLTLLLDSVSQLFSTGADIIGTTISTTSNVLFYVFLLPTYIFFLLYYHELFKQFLLDLIPEEQRQLGGNIISNIRNVVQNYVGGLAIVILIVASLNSIGFSLWGINYAVFFGFLISLLAIIPYFGILAGALLAFIYTFLTTDSLWYPLGVVVVTSVVQFLEGNIITPSVMGNQTQVNPFVLMVMLLFGGFLWGPVGMILSVPFTAIAKMVCDHIEPLKPFGRVLGTGKEVHYNTTPTLDAPTAEQQEVNKKKE